MQFYVFIIFKIALSTSTGLIPFLGKMRLLVPVNVGIPIKLNQDCKSVLENECNRGSKKEAGVYRLINCSSGSEWVKFKPPCPATKNLRAGALFFSYMLTSNLVSFKQAASISPALPPPTMATVFLAVDFKCSYIKFLPIYFDTNIPFNRLMRLM